MNKKKQIIFNYMVKQLPIEEQEEITKLRIELLKADFEWLQSVMIAFVIMTILKVIFKL